MSEPLAGAERRAGKVLAAAGIEDAPFEARLLLMQATGLDRAGLITRAQDGLDEDQAACLEGMLRRRQAREPIQHILGTTGFYGLEIRTDARALIPRPDSECVVEAALGRLPEDTAVQVADLGTGTGCLLAAVLTQRPRAHGEGVELSPQAASLARENIEALGLVSRASIFEGSWSGWQGWAQADLILSNPPYIETAAIAGLAPEVRAHDPLSALDGGPDGLAPYREIIRLAAKAMKAGAWLVFEIGYNQKDAVGQLLVQSGFENIASGQDLGGNDRWITGCRPR